MIVAIIIYLVLGVAAVEIGMTNDELYNQSIRDTRWSYLYHVFIWFFWVIKIMIKG